MTDDLLDRARQLAYDYGNLVEADVLWGLIERVQQTEAGESEQSDEADHWVGQLERAEAERDEARGKLDKVRALAESMQRAKVGGGFLSGSLNTADVLAILDNPETT